MNRGHRKKDRKRRFARIHNLTTRQRHDVRFRDEMLELAIQLTHLTQHYRPYICTISLVKSASPGIWLKARLSTVENRPTHSLKTSLTISPLKRACGNRPIVGEKPTTLKQIENHNEIICSTLAYAQRSNCESVQ